MKKFEYQEIDRWDYEDFKGIYHEITLKELGLEGWELCFIDTISEPNVWYFKREIEDK